MEVAEFVVVIEPLNVVSTPMVISPLRKGTRISMADFKEIETRYLQDTVLNTGAKEGCLCIGVVTSGILLG